MHMMPLDSQHQLRREHARGPDPGQGPDGRGRLHGLRRRGKELSGGSLLPGRNHVDVRPADSLVDDAPAAVAVKAVKE